MSLYRINPDDFEFFTIVANPKRTYSSSSISSIGITGSVNVFAIKSDVEKDIKDSPFIFLFFKDNNAEGILQGAKNNAIRLGNNNNSMRQYLTFVNNTRATARRSKVKRIKRFEPSLTFSDDTVKKTIAKDILLSNYRHIYPNSHFAYTNYNTINFFTSSLVSTGTVLLFPNSGSEGLLSSSSGSYALTGAFTFDFYINPRYSNDQAGVDFKAGTIFHLSSSYAVSLITGSSKDSNGRANAFRLQLQLSHSAQIAPSTATPGVYPNDLIFRSPDNSLKKNHWHHCAIRWGTNLVDNGTGSFFIDGVEVSTFVVPSASLQLNSSSLFPAQQPQVLCIGNFYDGANAGAQTNQSRFFDASVRTWEGLYLMNESRFEGIPSASLFRFEHPLNAEVHDLKMFRSFRTADEIISSSREGVGLSKDLIFYLPPFFVKESPVRTVSGSNGGVFKTPFVAGNGTTIAPFNISMSFGVGGYYVNLENYGRDFATGLYGRWLNLSGSQFSSNASLSANEFLYATASIRKRNLTILPCDNGKFLPNFNLLKSGTLFSKPGENSNHSRFVDDLGVLNLGFISLKNLVSTSSYLPELLEASGAFYNNLVGVYPENFTGTPTNYLGVLQRTRDTSSNEVVMFDISNIFFGNRINPKSLIMFDSSLTGSGGKVSMTLRDDGFGNLYRADCLTEHATWSSVGNVFYNEGVILIKSPNIPKFGKDQFEMEFEGEQTIHTMKIVSELPAGMVNSSSHPEFIPVSASLLANDSDTEFVYITNVYYFDENLNVLMKSNLAQPIKKRNGDKFIIKSSIDF